MTLFQSKGLSQQWNWVANLAGAYPGYCCMKQLGVLQALSPSLLLMHEAFTSIISPPPFLDGMLVQPIPFPKNKKNRFHWEFTSKFKLLGWEKPCESKLSCLRTQLNITVRPPCLLGTMTQTLQCQDAYFAYCSLCIS